MAAGMKETFNQTGNAAENIKTEFWSHESSATEFVFPSGNLPSSFSR